MSDPRKNGSEPGLSGSFCSRSSHSSVFEPTNETLENAGLPNGQDVVNGVARRLVELYKHEVGADGAQAYNARLPEFKEAAEKYLSFCQESAENIEKAHGLLHRQAIGEASVDITLAGRPGPDDVDYRALANYRSSLSRETVLSGLIEGLNYKEILTHPAAIEARLALKERGFIAAPKKEIPAFDLHLEEYIADSFSGCGIQPVDPLPGDGTNESTTEGIATGMWVYSANNLVTRPVNGSSMWSVVGPKTQATLALVGATSFASCDAIWSDLTLQKAQIEHAFKLIDNDPILQIHAHKNYTLSNGQVLSDYLRDEAKKLVGVTLKPFPPKAAAQAAAEFYEMGVRVFRIYDPGATNASYDSTRAVAEALKAVRDRVGGSDVTLFVGQVVGPTHAKGVIHEGANAVIIGIGDGRICSTAREATLTADNMKVGYRIQSALERRVPILFEGGVNGGLPVALLMGASGQTISGQMLGGRVETPGGWYKFLKNTEIEYAHIYPGEASILTKILGGQVNRDGTAKHEEGVHQIVYLDQRCLSIARAMHMRFEGVAKSARFARLNSCEGLRLAKTEELPKLLMHTTESRFAAMPHRQH